MDKVAKKATRTSNNRPKDGLTHATMIDLYEAREHLGINTHKETGLRMKVRVYFKDPAVAPDTEGAGIDDEFMTIWEPGLSDGPTSARFAVVDYDSTNNTLTPPAIWNSTNNCYLAPDGKTVLDDKVKELYQYHQLSVWAIAQNTLDFFEGSRGLGRRISWAFKGNRLIIVPHAGYGENAYYDRASKSLQFYWFDDDKGRVFTCLSSDIVNHELGHAILDGLRPHYYESIGIQTAAFHEFFGDVTALLAFRNNAFRKVVLKESGGELTNAQLLAGLAQQFGMAALSAPYLRSGLNKKTMEDLAGNLNPHVLAEVLTGAMFDIVVGVFAKYRKDEVKRLKADGSKRPSDITAMADTTSRIQEMFTQALDLLPPCEVTFRDYALAVLRAEQVADPTDASGYRRLIIDCFIKRGILQTDRTARHEQMSKAARPALDIFGFIHNGAFSRGEAYRFIDDNRATLFIPPNVDVVICEIVRANKVTREGRALPEQIVVQYIWREELMLEGARFGRFAGQRTTMLCGATIVFDQNGNLIHWARKPGSASVGASKVARAEQAEGLRRRKELLDTIAARIAAGMIGESIGGELGLLERAMPPFAVQQVDGSLRFGLAPHFSLHEDDECDRTGERHWQISF